MRRYLRPRDEVMGEAYLDTWGAWRLGNVQLDRLIQQGYDTRRSRGRPQDTEFGHGLAIADIRKLQTYGLILPDTTILEPIHIPIDLR